MNESEFRDWARGAFGNYDDRLRRVEGRVSQIAAAATAPRVGGELAISPIEMAEQLLKAARGGGIRGVAVVYLGPDGPIDGWSCTGEEEVRLALYGAVSFLADSVVHPVRVAGAAPGGTDEGSPEAREVAASAPAGGIVAE
jgi:hypothetical protein